MDRRQIFKLPAAKKAEKTVKPAMEKTVPPEVKIEINKIVTKDAEADKELVISQARLEEAIIWSEILSKPVSRRRKRR